MKRRVSRAAVKMKEIVAKASKKIHAFSKTQYSNKSESVFSHFSILMRTCNYFFIHTKNYIHIHTAAVKMSTLSVVMYCAWPPMRAIPSRSS